MADSTVPYPCPECQVGNLRPRRVSYFTMEGRNLVCVPDFPAWVCDVCGRRDYDSSALAELRAMLDTTRRGARRPRPRPQPPATSAPPPSAAPRRRS
ncbi:MAG: YgiT-type zinc finger protein [Anaerolineales bacterium]|nr:YgiT-type zinc finger protein [Anaerolineales bacterium]